MKIAQLLLLALTLMLRLNAQKTYDAPYLNTTPVLDGILDDSLWASVPVAADFTTTLPYFGRQPKHATEVRMVQTSSGFYLAVTCFSGAIRADGSARDNLGTGDYFTLGLDSWNDDQNAFVFGVTAAGQIYESRKSSNNDELRYDCRWKARVKRYADRWTMEMYLPFSSLRYSRHKMTGWGLQFSRYDRTSGELSTWNPQDPLILDQVLQYGTLGSLGAVATKIRMGLNFMADANDQIYNDVGSGLYSGNIRLGLDASIGFSPSTTLNSSIYSREFYMGSLLSDYYQKDFAPNLPEPRQMNAEESGIWHKTGVSMGFPTSIGYEVMNEVPIDDNQVISLKKWATPLHNAKFTSRTQNNIGIGIANMIFTKPEFTIVTFDPSSGTTLGAPHTKDYDKLMDISSIAVEKSLPNNSWIQVFNQFSRLGGSANSNMASVNTQLRDKSNRHQFTSNLKVSTEPSGIQGTWTTRSEGGFSVSKINSKYNWSAGYEHFKEPLFQSAAADIRRFRNHDRAYAEFSRRNFEPRRKYWLNYTDALSVDLTLQNANLADRPLNVSVSRRALDRFFRQWHVQMTASPLKDEEILQFSGSKLSRNLPPVLGFHGGVTTDSRKKGIFSAGLSLSSWNIATNYFKSGTNAGFTWVPKRKCLIFTNHSLSFQSDALTRLNGLNNGVEIYDALVNRHSLRFRFVPQKNIMLDLWGDWEYRRRINREAFRINSSGSLVPDGFSVPYGSSLLLKKALMVGFDVNLFYHNGTQLRLNVTGMLGNFSVFDEPAGPVFGPIIFPGGPDFYTAKRLGYNLVAIYNFQ